MPALARAPCVSPMLKVHEYFCLSAYSGSRLVGLPLSDSAMPPRPLIAMASAPSGATRGISQHAGKNATELGAQHFPVLGI